MHNDDWEIANVDIGTDPCSGNISGRVMPASFHWFQIPSSQKTIERILAIAKDYIVMCICSPIGMHCLNNAGVCRVRSVYAVKLLSYVLQANCCALGVEGNENSQ